MGSRSVFLNKKIICCAEYPEQLHGAAQGCLERGKSLPSNSAFCWLQNPSVFTWVRTFTDFHLIWVYRLTKKHFIALIVLKPCFHYASSV